ncbi:hypothetical protein ACFLTI_07445 [Bacteroidota bacterium]
MNSFYLMCIVFIVLIIRLTPRLIFRNIYSFRDDSWHVFVAAHAIRKNHHKIPKKIDNYILENEHDYPPLLPWLLSFLTKSQIGKFEKYIPAIIDSLYAILFWYFAKHVLNAIYVANTQLLFLSTIYFITYPLFFFIGKGPRTFKISPRILSEFFVSCYAISLLLFVTTNQNIWIILVIISGLFQALTNRFGLQVIILFSIFIGVLFNSLWIVCLPFLIISLMFILFGRMWGRMLSGFIGHGIFMRKYWYNPKRNLNLIQKGKKLNKKSGGLLSRIFQTYIKNRIIISLLHSPGIWLSLFGIFYLFVTNNSFDINPILLFCIFWTCTSVFMMILFSIPDLIFWGTGDRYLYYSIPFQVIILVYVIVQLNLPYVYFYFLITLNLIPFLLNILLLYRINKGNQKLQKKEEEFYNWLRTFNSELRILPILGGKAHKFVYKLQCCVLDVEYSYRPWIFSENKTTELFAGYGYPNPKNIENILTSYNINLIICYKNSIETAKQHEIFYDFSSYTLEFENEVFSAYSCNLFEHNSTNN